MRRLAPALAVCACFGASSCGKPEQGARGRSVSVPAGGVLRVVAREYSFDPSQVTVSRGGVKIELDNRGSLVHDLRVERGGRRLGGTPAFERGTRSATLRLAPGRYRFLCTVGDHAKLGMRGTLTVKG